MLENGDLKRVQETIVEAIEQLILPQFEGIYHRLAKIETRLDGVEFRLSKVESRLDGVEFRLDKVESRLNNLDEQMSSVKEQLGFLTTEMKIVKEYVISHQEKLEDHEERIKVAETKSLTEPQNLR